MATESERAYLQEAKQFLGRDFDQCFAEKRRCEDVAWDTCKFAFTVHSGIVALAVAGYQFSLEKGIDLLPVAMILLGMGVAVGLFLLLLLVRNRVYFVIVTRYINEHRSFFLQGAPLGFRNETLVYTSASEPPYFSWASTQMWGMHLVAALNAVAGGALLYLLLGESHPRRLAALLVIGIAFVLQATAVRMYLRSREGKSASEAAFGNNAQRRVTSGESPPPEGWLRRR